MQFGSFGGTPNNQTSSPEPSFQTLSVDHDKGVFKSVNGLSLGESLDVIFLGLVRQRDLWVDGEKGRKLACESADAETGYAKANYFPYDTAGFDSAKYPGPPSGEIVALKCDDCQMRKWQDGSGGNRKPPPCTSSWVMPFVYPGSLDTTVTDEQLLKVTRLLPVKYSSQRTLEKYLTPFRDSKTPTYTVATNVGLSRRSRNGKVFADMKFNQGKRVDASAYPKLSGALRTVREHLTQPPQLPAGAFRPMTMGR